MTAADRHTVSESADKITLKATVKRGTATRDEDKIAVKVKASDPTAAVDQLDAVLDRLTDTSTTLRTMQPEGGE